MYWDKYIVTKLLKYKQFLNESTFYKMNDLPWEKEGSQIISEIYTIKEKLESRLVRGSYRFNIKVYNYPNIEKLSAASGKGQDFIYSEYDQYLTDRLTSFIEDLEEEFQWIGTCFQEGRSGGWLAIEPEEEPDDITHEIEDSIDYYLNMKEHYNFPLTSEELEEIDFFLNSNKLLYDLGIAEKPQIIKDLYDPFYDSLKDLIEVKKRWGRILSDLIAIEKRIEESKESLVEDFEKHFLEEYGKDDKEV